MLIVHITLNFFSHGAVMRRARQETMALLKAGHQVIAITDLKGTSALKELKDFKDELLIVPLKTVFIYGIRNLSSQLSFTFKVYFALKKIAEKESINLIISHGSIPCYAVTLFTKNRKIPSVWVIQDLIRDRLATGNPYNWLETLIFKHSNPYALRNINFLIPVSRYTKKLAIMDGAPPENTFVKHNAIDTLTFSPNEEIPKDIDILFIGRLSIEKGVDILIDSVDYFNETRSVVIIGDGPLVNQLKKQAKEKNHKIKFLGFIYHEKLPYYIRRAKLVVVPSRSECHAAVPLECMACGVPVIASNVGGMEDSIYHDQDGWLLNKNDAVSLAIVINEAFSNKEKLEKISQSAIKKSRKFSEKNFEKEIVHFYMKLIESFNKSNN